MVWKWIAAAALVVLVAKSQASAQQSIRILTPTTDTCHAYIKAMHVVDPADIATLAALTGWFTGFLSGVAEGTGIDFLRNENIEKLGPQVYNDCLKQPESPLSVVVEEIARSLIKSHQVGHP
jgi:hypothetical protein